MILQVQGVNMKAKKSNIKCAMCNNFISVNSKKYCSSKCHNEDLKIKSSWDRVAIWTEKCRVCDKIVKRPRAVKRDGNIADNIYCSRKCYLVVHKEKISYKKCPSCNNNFKISSQNRSAKYCNELCRRLYNQILVVKKHHIIAVTIDNKFYVKRCKICNNLFEMKKRRADNTICSKECVAENYRTNEARKKKISFAFIGEKHPNFIHHPMRNNKRDIPTREIKKYVHKLFNRKCFKCNSTDNLAIDHHIPNKKGGYLDIGNAVLLCKRCNTQKSAKDPEEFYSKKELGKLEKMGIHRNNLFNFKL